MGRKNRVNRVIARTELPEDWQIVVRSAERAPIMPSRTHDAPTVKAKRAKRRQQRQHDKHILMRDMEDSRYV